MRKLKAQSAKRKATVQIAKLLSFTLLLYALTFALYTTPAYAACVDPVKGVQIGECFGYGNITSLGEAINKLVMPIFSIATALVIIYFLWGAFNFLKSGGNKEELAGARQMIVHAIIGFLILMFAFLILQFLLFSLFGITNLKIF